jgi:hypothetical protein
MKDQVPPQPPKSFRITLEVHARLSRMDNKLLASLKEQTENPQLQAISRAALKKLFTDGRIQIKGQRARPSSALAKGITYVDILGY